MEGQENIQEQAVDTAQDTQETTDNTSVETTENTADNSEEYSQEEISKALDEADKEETEPAEDKQEEPQEEKKEETKDNTIECPEKFKNKDGSTNLEKLLKSYTDLESYSSKQKSEWDKERAELLKYKEQADEVSKQREAQAQQAGFESVREMEQSYELAYVEANEYAKYLQYTDSPEDVREMLIKYANNPSKELMEEIELEFSPEINKNVAITAERKKQEFNLEKQQYANTARMTAIENVIGQSVDYNPEIFNYEPVKNLFVSTLQKYGDNFTNDDAKLLIDTFAAMKEAIKSELTSQTETRKENNNETDKLSSFGSNGSAPGARQLTNADIDNMSSAELAKEIRKYL